MLRELHITNLAVIEDVRLELEHGLTCFTGQTGAGKSLILGAFEVLLGLRSGGEMIRGGAPEARVSGLFELHDPALAAAAGELIDQSLEAGEQLLITRKLFSSGRSSLSVNGLPATSAMVRNLGELLVDIHGQHDHQFLLKPANQLLILDTFGGCFEQRQEYARSLTELRALQNRQQELAASRTLRKQQLDLYQFQADEIDGVNPLVGEFPQLRARHARLSNLQKIHGQVGAAHQALYESDDAIVSRLQMTAHLLLEIAELDAELVPLAEQVRTATLTLQESSYDLARYLSRLDMDPGQLVEVEERLNQLNRLLAKYAHDPIPGEDPVAGLLSYRRQLDELIRSLRGEDEDLGQMQARVGQLRGRLTELSGQLGKARRAAAARLQPLVEGQLKDLGMAEARLEVAFTAEPDAELGKAALETAEMLVQTNPGQPARPLRKIASGGELSRIMLALKAILAQHDRVSILVFDEIDANIGGRMGTVIGEKLRHLAGGSKGRATSGKAKPGSLGQQVLCITHLPQIAAYADRHLRIDKTVAGKVKDKQTRTTVSVLDGQQRIDELAEMLAGKQVSATTRAQARELLAAAGH